MYPLKLRYHCEDKNPDRQAYAQPAHKYCYKETEGTFTLMKIDGDDPAHEPAWHINNPV